MDKTRKTQRREVGWRWPLPRRPNSSPEYQDVGGRVKAEEKTEKGGQLPAAEQIMVKRTERRRAGPTTHGRRTSKREVGKLVVKATATVTVQDSDPQEETSGSLAELTSRQSWLER